MRHLLTCLLLACAGAACAQPERAASAPDPDLGRAFPAWLVGDHAQAALCEQYAGLPYEPPLGDRTE